MLLVHNKEGESGSLYEGLCFIAHLNEKKSVIRDEEKWTDTNRI